MTVPSTAVTVVDANRDLVTYNLDSFPVERFNRLIPTQTISMPSDLIRPVVQVVALEERDSYTSPDVPNGSRAINRVGLRKLATAAGISILNERRVDDGSDPDVCEMTCEAEMVLPTGQRIRAPGTKRINLGHQRWASDAQRLKFRSFFQEHVASRAQNRAVRALLSLQASYPIRELAKPFAVVSFAPNMDHPEVRARILDAMVPTVARLYGAESNPSLQIGPGDVKTVAPAPDDDAEPVASSDEEPPHPGGAAAPATGAAAWLDEAEKAEAGQPFADAIRATAAEPDAPKGQASAPQLATLKRIFAGYGRELVGAGFAALWGAEAATAMPSAAQVRALELAYDSDPDGFRAGWDELAGGAS